MRCYTLTATLLALAISVFATSFASKSSTEKSPTGLLSLAADAQGLISAALGKDDSDYWLHQSAVGFRGENPRHALEEEFTQQGAEVRSHSMRWGLETRGYGYGNTFHPVKAVAPRAKANRVEYRREAVTEWYENGPSGLEQGFTLARRPGKANGQALTLNLELRGDLVASLEEGGKGLKLRGQDGKTALCYTGLQAQDATGRKLRSWLELRGKRLLVRVEDGGARYPVVVDPWVQETELTASNGAANDEFGYSVALDGSTAVVGAAYHAVGSNAEQGVAYVFVESGGTWSQQAELTASDGAAADLFGVSVAVSGNMIVVGAPVHASGQGAAYVFVESGGTWSQQAELTASDGGGNDRFGHSVAVSGSTALVGAYAHKVGSNKHQGAAYVFVESGGSWSQQAQLTASDGVELDEFGSAVAISSSTAVVGAPYHMVGSNTQQGAMYVFVESSGKWAQQAELVASDGAAQDQFGKSVAVDGGTAVVGGPKHAIGSNTEQGVAYVYVDSEGTWSQQAELTASDGSQNDRFGHSVAVSGSTIMVGAWYHTLGSNTQQGAAYVFVGSGGKWSQQAELTSSDGKADDEFGSSVTVDGSTAAVGAPYHMVGSNTQQGAAYVYVLQTTQTTVLLSPTSLNFGNEVVKNTSAAKTVTLTNTGDTTLDISNIDVTPTANFEISSHTCGSTLDAGDSCKVSVEFKPTALGPLTASLVFTDNASNNPQSVPLSGTGVEPVTLSPSSGNFGKQKVGTTSKAKTFTLTNEQSVQLTGIKVSITGKDPQDFPYSTTCGTTLAAGKKCTISVTFKPRTTGMRTGELRVSDKARNSPQTASMTGTGD